VRISKTASNTSEQHDCGSVPQVPDRDITKCVLVVIPLAFSACNWSVLPTETLLREYSRAAEKLSSIDQSAVTKGLGTIALVYIFQTLIVDITDCLGHP